jgi:hypothetical protein
MTSLRRVHLPAGPDWGHEFKHDGYGLHVRRNGEGAGCSRGAIENES